MGFDLSSYGPGINVIERFSKTKFSVIAGPAAAGKDTLREVLLEKYPKNYQRIISLTDRKPREYETNGQDYYFVTRDEIIAKANKKSLIQLANVHNQQFSAIDSHELNKVMNKQIGLSILIVQTEKQLREINPNIKTIFLIPPSIDEMLNRLKIGRPKDKNEEIRRLTAAKKEIEIALNEPGYYCLVSEDQYKNAELVNDFLRNNQKDAQANEQARKVMLSMVGKL